MAKCFIAGRASQKQYAAVAEVLEGMSIEPIMTTDIQPEPRRMFINKSLLRLMGCDMLCLLPKSDEDGLAAFEKAYAGTARMPILHAYLVEGKWYIK